jgi:hypothetical protein
MSATDPGVKPLPDIGEVAGNNPGVEAEKVREARDMIREVRKTRGRRELPAIGSPYGAGVRKKSTRGFGTTYG